MKKNDFPKYLSEFLSLYLPGQRNVSVNTIASYRDAFKLFLIFWETSKKIRIENISISMITRDVIIDFLNWLEESRKIPLLQEISLSQHYMLFFDMFKEKVQRIFLN